MRWVFLATDNIASLTNAHHGRPVFFNLQTNSAAAVGWDEWSGKSGHRSTNLSEMPLFQVGNQHTPRFL